MKKERGGNVKECVSCKEEIKQDASRCPYCGQKQIGFTAIFSAIVIMLFIGYVILALIG